MFVDSHCHLDKLDVKHYPNGLDDALEEAAAAGVSKVLCIGIDLENIDTVLKLAERHPQVYASVGVHPLYQKSREPTTKELIKLADHPKVVAIGETGLDYFYCEGDLQWQRQRFQSHIEASLETNLPLIVHTRSAKNDTLQMLKDLGKERISGVLHCFTEDLDMAQQAIELGFSISISGIATFKNADALRCVIRELPIEKLLIETDAPWLTPMPFRGKPNEPKHVVEVAKMIANLKNMSLDDVARQTTKNFHQLFKKAL